MSREQNKRESNKILLWSILGAVLLSGILYVGWNAGSSLKYSGKIGKLERLYMILDINPLILLLLAVFLFFVIQVCIRYGTYILDFLYRYRFLVAAALFVLCIVFEISGSSIAYYGEHLGTDISQRGILFGTCRGERADEWATYIPMALSQYENYTGAFPYYSDIIRGTATDTFIVYGQPVADIAIIFRPFQWGYLFLNPARGLSFFWCGRFIALFLVTFEIGMLITKKQKRYSFLMALMVLLAPLVQWWFAINGLVEMLVFGQLAILLAYTYMNTKHYWKRLLCAVFLAVCGGGFILVFYPSWQVPMAYIFGALFLWVVLENRKRFSFAWKKDIPLFVLFFLLLGGGMAYVLFKSQDAIMATLHTVYPGGRFEQGGGWGLQPLRYMCNLLFPVYSAPAPSELSLFYDFAPLGILLSAYVLFKEKKRDKLLIIMLTLGILLWCYVTVPIPKVLAKITLLSFAQAGRVVQVMGFVNLILLFRSLAVMDWRPGKAVSGAVACAGAAVVAVVNYKIYRAYGSGYPHIILLSAMAGVLALGIYLFLRNREGYMKGALTLFMTGIMLCMGGLVNPVQKGLDVIYDTPLMEEITAITDEDPSALWICDSIGYPMNDYTIIGGAAAIDSINVYPDLERWRVLDPDGKYEDIYNRYAHIHIEVVQEETSFELLQMADSFRLRVNPDDLKKLDVSYILTNRDLTVLASENTKFELIQEANGYQIYKVIYTS